MVERVREEAAINGHLVYHGSDPEVCQWVIDNYENREDLKDNLSVQGWIQYSKHRLRELGLLK